MDYITEFPEELAKALHREDSFDFESIKSLGDLKHETLLYWGEHKFFSFAEALCLFLYNIEQQQGMTPLEDESIEFKVLYHHYFQQLLNNWLAPFSAFIPVLDDSLLSKTDKYTTVLKSLEQGYQQFLFEYIKNEKPLELVTCYQYWLKLCDQVWIRLIGIELQRELN